MRAERVHAGMLGFLLGLHLAFSAGAVSAQADHCGEARRYFGQALETKSAAGDIHSLIEKEKLYRKAIELCPDYAEAHNNLGDIYESLGKYAEAIEEYTRAIEANRKLAASYAGLGDVHFKSGRYGEAIKWYDAAMELDPGDQTTLDLRRQAEALITTKVIPKASIVQILGRSQMLTRGPGDAVKITFGADKVKGMIPFDYEKAEIRDDAKPQLKELGEALASPDLAGYVFEIGGHTDTRGSEAYNFELSLKRAKAVKEHLVANFRIPVSRLREKGYGSSRVIATGNDEASHAMNRRVEVTRLEAVRSSGSDGKTEPPTSRIAVDVGFLYHDGKTGHKAQMDPGGRTVIRTGTDFYQIFFRPLQSCYVYLLQKDSTGKWYILFPVKDSQVGLNPVLAGKEYWVPSFDKGFSGDRNKGDETIYFLASTFLVTDLESPGPDLEKRASTITRSFVTRGFSHIGKPDKASGKGAAGSQDYARMITHLESEGAMVRAISFLHE
jgi:outer membrane protein OmpA-like peptidoglycan-associated protein